MVGIVVVSHSDALARGVVTLAREMSPPELALEPAGGIGEAGVLGTSAELIGAAIERAMSADGVLVLMDLGSALMSAELAVELLQGASGPVRLSPAPLVEGTVAAAAAAGGGATLDQVAAEAVRALAMKSAQIGSDDDVSAAEPTAATELIAEAEGELLVSNDVGLHARPAARFVETAGRFDAQVLISKVGSAEDAVSARSLTNIVALGARRGDSVRVLARGPQAAEALAALRELAAGGFGDGVAVADAPPGGPGGPGGPGEAPASGRPMVAPEPGTELRGTGVGSGVVWGPIRMLTATVTSARTPGDPAHELEQFERARQAARRAITSDRERLRAGSGDQQAEIFDAHLALLEDDALLTPAREAIAQGTPAEVAIVDAAKQVAEIYRRLENPLLAERATDVLDVGGRIASRIDAASAATAATEPEPQRVILIADELTPSQTVGLDSLRVAGIATARGSATAHAAIIARSLGIPAVVGLGAAILAVAPGTPLLLDGGAGMVVVAPSAELLSASGARGERERARDAAARRRAHEPGMLAGGERIEIFANVGSVADARLAVERGAEGVGLLRTEFLFLNRPTLPGEDEQAAVLRQIAGALDDRPLVIRTLDAGADKPLPALHTPSEANPFLGVRGIRLGLRHPELLATQMRATLRVAAERPLKLMLPMVASLDEIRSARALLERAREQTEVSSPIELGVMVEVPAAALMAAELAPHVDFFSIGTNDLTQYTMAAERGNARLEALLAEPQPAVLRLIQMTLEAARVHRRWVGVCGELAGDPAAAVLLAGLGVTELSMAPRLIPRVKQALRGVDLVRARAAAEMALRSTSAAQARDHGLALLAG